MKKYTIGQIAKEVGLPAKTIRFYEDEGIINRPSRSENGYRFYNESDIEGMRIIKYARELGLPLAEMKKLMKGCDDGHCEHSQEYIRNSIDNYLGILEKKINQMTLLKSKLTGLKNELKNKSCDQGKYCCDILHQLIVYKDGGNQNDSTL